MDWAPWILKKRKKWNNDRPSTLDPPSYRPRSSSPVEPGWPTCTKISSFNFIFQVQMGIHLFQCDCCENFNFIFYHSFKNLLHLWQPQYRSWKVNVYKKGWMFTQTVHHRRPSRSGCFKRKLLRKGAVFIRLLIVVKKPKSEICKIYFGLMGGLRFVHVLCKDSYLFWSN